MLGADMSLSIELAEERAAAVTVLLLVKSRPRNDLAKSFEATVKVERKECGE